MKLDKAIQTLEKMKVPVHSQILAGQYMNQNLPTIENAKVLIQQLTNQSCSERGKDKNFVPYVAAYLVMYIVRSHIARDHKKVIDLLRDAKVRTDNFLVEMAWSFVEDEADQAIENADPEIVRAGRAKKGAKKFLGLKIWAKKIKNKDITRKEGIAILMEDVGVSAAGASTYYANFKSGKWA